MLEKETTYFDAYRLHEPFQKTSHSNMKFPTPQKEPAFQRQTLCILVFRKKRGRW